MTTRKTGLLVPVTAEQIADGPSPEAARWFHAQFGIDDSWRTPLFQAPPDTDDNQETDRG